MKRDMDMVRRLLVEIEALPLEPNTLQFRLTDVADDVLQYHLILLAEADLIHAMDLSDNSGTEIIPTRLTWKGHEFLDASRNDAIWLRAKASVLAKTGGLAFDVLLAVLKDYATRTVLGPSAV